MAVAAFLLTLSCTMAPAAPGVVPHDECAVMELQRFDNATLAEIEDCASMADALLLMNRQGSRCEVVPMAATGEHASLDTLDNAAQQLPSNTPTTLQTRVRYSGATMRYFWDNSHYTF